MPANYVLAPFPSLTSVATFSRPAAPWPPPSLPPRLRPLPSIHNPIGKGNSDAPAPPVVAVAAAFGSWQACSKRGRGGARWEGRGGGGGGRGKFQLRLKKADRPALVRGRAVWRARRPGGRQVVFFTGKGISETRPYLGGRRGGEEEEGRLTVHTIKQAVCSEAGRVQTVFRHHSVAAVLPQARHRKEGRKEGRRKKCSADFSC